MASCLSFYSQFDVNHLFSSTLEAGVLSPVYPYPPNTPHLLPTVRALGSNIQQGMVMAIGEERCLLYWQGISPACTWIERQLPILYVVEGRTGLLERKIVKPANKGSPETPESLTLSTTGLVANRICTRKLKDKSHCIKATSGWNIMLRDGLVCKIAGMDLYTSLN
ncbi:hypothetical protein AKJ16_DCAP20067 [Drosera capensis]